MENISLDEIAVQIGKLKGEGEELLDALTLLVVEAFPKVSSGRQRNRFKAKNFHQALMTHAEVVSKCLAACDEINDVKGIMWSIKVPEGEVTHWLIARPQGMPPPKTVTDLVLCDGAPFKEEGVHSLDTRTYMQALSERQTLKTVRRGRGRGRGPSKMQELSATAARANKKRELDELLESHGGEKSCPFPEVYETRVGGFQALLRATRIRLWQKGDFETLSKITPVGKDPYTHSERHRKIWFKREVCNEQTLPELLKGKEPCTLVLETSHCPNVIQLLRECDLKVERA